MADPLLCSFFEETEKRMMDHWRKSAPEDKDGRELIFHYLTVLQNLKGYLQNYVESGPIALDTLETLYGKR